MRLGNQEDNGYFPYMREIGIEKSISRCSNEPVFKQLGGFKTLKP